MENEWKLNVVVKKITPEESIIEVETLDGIEKLVIIATEFGHEYDSFDNWTIGMDEYHDLEEFVDSIMEQMNGKESTLNVTYELQQQK